MPPTASADARRSAPADTADLDPRRWRALPVILVGSFLAFLDFFIVNIALPAMRDDLGARPAELQLVVAGYGIGFAVFLITGGRLGDIFGRRRMFLVGIAGFTLASLLCGLAPTAPILIAARVLQAITAAIVVPQVLAIIRVEFAARERPFAVGLYGTSMGFASILAQLLGGLLVSGNLFGWSWRLIFLINVPIGIAAIVLASRTVRESRGPGRPTVDLVGVGLATLGLVLLIYPIVEGREAGWPAWSLAMLAAAAPVFVGFVRHEQRVVRRGGTPLLALQLLRLRTVAIGLLVSIVFFSGVGAFFVVLTVFFQEGFGYSPLAAGLMFLPFAIGFTGASAVSGSVAARIGPRILNLGMLLMMIGLLGTIALARIASAAPIAGAIDERSLAALFLVYGLGQGLVQPSLISTVVGSSGVSGEDAGSAAGLFLTTAQSSIALGVAAIGGVFFSRLGAAPTAGGYLDALSTALSCNLVLQAAAFVLVHLLPRAGRNSSLP